MKVTSILFAAVLATTSVQAMPTQEPSPEVVQVTNTKRAVEAIADALAAPMPFRNIERDPRKHVKEIWCYRPGEPCYKAKRDALALASAFAEADASDKPVDSGKQFSHTPLSLRCLTHHSIPPVSSPGSIIFTALSPLPRSQCANERSHRSHGARPRGPRQGDLVLHAR